MSLLNKSEWNVQWWVECVVLAWEGKSVHLPPQMLTPCDLTSDGESVSRSVVSDSSRPHGLWPTRLLCPWNFPGKNTGVGRYCLLQGIFLTQGSNPDLLHCRQIVYHLSHQGSSLTTPRTLANLLCS